MKARTAASIIAFSYLRNLRAHISGRCMLEIVSDEEAGGRWGTMYLLEDDGAEEWKGDRVLVAAPATHGAYTHHSAGAIRIASRFIEGLVALEERDLGMDESIRGYMQQPGVRKLADEIMRPGASNSMLFPTVNIGTIQGGTSINMVASECTFTADIRIPIGAETKAVREYIDDTVQHFDGVSYSVRENHSHEAACSDPKHEMVSLLQKNARALRGEIPSGLCSLGATDCKHFRSHGIPSYVYGLHPRGMAERDARVSIDEFLDTIRVHALTAWDYIGGPQ
jgi:acetylornithine deacetylase/succinyl-diaminopimelate desuccinylase-like protein